VTQGASLTAAPRFDAESELASWVLHPNRAALRMASMSPSHALWSRLAARVAVVSQRMV
jgi:hypothetical protein